MINYFKKIFGVSLLVIIFAFNAVPVSFADTQYICNPSDECLSAQGLGGSANCSIDNSSAAVAALPGCLKDGRVGFPADTVAVRCKCTVDTGTIPAAKSCSEEDITKKPPVDTCVAPSKQIWNATACNYSCSCPSGTETGPQPTCPTNQSPVWNADTCKYVCAASNVFQPDTNIKTVITPYAARVTIPCDTTAIGVNGQCPVADNPAGYIARLYQFGLMIVGFIALGAIIYGAALYTLSAGNMASKEAGKEWMLNAIYGILLLLGAYLILYTINPSLVNLTNPTVEPINLDTLLPPDTYQAASTSQNNNTLAENNGQALVGCLVSKSSGGMFGISTTNNGQEISSLSTSNGGVECAKCAAGNDLVNGACVCTAPLVRQSDGTCGASTLVLKACPTGYAHDTDTTCNSCAAGYRKDSAGKCVLPTVRVSCTSGYAGPDGKCLP